MSIMTIVIIISTKEKEKKLTSELSFDFFSNDFSFGAGSSIQLVGGITSDRIFFAGATAMKIGDGVHFIGTVLVHTNVVVGLGAQINGTSL